MNYYSIGTTWIEVYMQGGDFSDMTEIAPKSPKNADRRPERTGRLGSFDSGVFDSPSKNPRGPSS